MEKHYKPKKQKKDENPFEDQPLFKPPTLDVNIGELDPQMAYMRDYHQQIVSHLLGVFSGYILYPSTPLKLSQY